MSFNSGYIVSTFLMEVLTIAKEKDLLINNEIRCGSMLVIGPKGEQLGVKSRSDALTLADYAGFDLVLINENANPPVCKLMDYKKYKYEKKKKQKENDKKQRESSFEVKEYRLSVTIDKHDFDTKMNNAKKHLEKGNKIKASIRFKGRQLAHTELGEEVLRRFADALSEVSEIEQQPKFEFKSIYMVLAPKK
ncbi:translation initiation factor IF-3 [Clostridium sp. CAG:1193]|nr:translation initiation factor IF-3 [Clostridium sp. CAG:1193]